MGNLTTVSVIIPTYNYGRFISSAIASALEQDHRPEEVIVVDDGSTDDTLTILRKFGNRITILTQKNRGPAAARNLGVRHATGELIAFLDADDVWLPGKLSKQVLKLIEGGFGLVHCGLRYVDEKGIKLRDEICGEEGRVSLAMLRHRGVLQGIGSSGLLRREDYVNIGGMDESLRVAEDWDLGYRLARRHLVGFVPEPLVLYRQHQTSNRKKNASLHEECLRRVFARAFAEQSVQQVSIRREAYGNLYIGFAITDYGDSQYYHCALNLVRSLWYRPSLIGRPFRFARRRLTAKEVA